MSYDFEHRSFGERHPVLATLALVAFGVFALIPALAMFSKPVACAMGAAETWCPADGGSADDD